MTGTCLQDILTGFGFRKLSRHETMQSWRAKRAKIQQVRDLVGEHAKEAAVRLPSVVSFLRDPFGGKPFEAL